LQRCINDNDDEVRNRGKFYLKVLQSNQETMQKFILEDFSIPIANLEKSLMDYQKNPTSAPFDIRSVSLTVVPEAGKKPAAQTGSKAAPVSVSSSVSSPEISRGEGSNSYANLLASIPQFANLGPLFKSSKPVELTESETEYVVNVVKHIFNDHIVLQFNCTNTIAEQLLENVSVRVDASDVKDAKVEFTLPIASLPNGAPGSAFVCLKKTPGSYPTGAFQNVLRFTVKEFDPTTGEAEDTGVDDDYSLESFQLTTSDYMQQIHVTNFEQKWNEVGDEFEVQETYALSSAKTLQDGVNDVITFLGMQPVDRTDKVKPKSTKHILLLAGNYLGGIAVAVEAKMKFVEGQGVAMQMTVRSTNDDISTAIASAI